MKRLTFSFLVLVILSSVTSPGYPCGDKFLVNSKCLKPRNMLTAQRPGVILLYRNPASELTPSVLKDDLIGRLEQAGHDVTVVETIEAVEKELATDRYDIVVGDIADAGVLDGGTGDRTSLPLFLPIMDKKAPKNERSAAREQYGSLLKAPGRLSTTMLLIDGTVRKAREARSVSGPSRPATP
ncbi:MAG: hypothetical protein V3V49_01850 [Candidatus Krumholzibacteria bacterium]